MGKFGEADAEGCDGSEGGEFGQAWGSADAVEEEGAVVGLKFVEPAGGAFDFG